MKNIFASSGLRKLVNYNIVSLEDIDDEMRTRFIEYFDKIRSDLDTFIHVESDYNIKKVNTDMGKQHALIKEWTSEQKSTSVEIWITKNKYYIGYAIKYESTKMCLIFGNNGGNPFVVIPDLGFFNIIEDIMDDSYYKIDFVNMNINEITDLIKKMPYKIINTIEYSNV